jgi:predicted permease
MSIWSRIRNTFHGDRLSGDIDEELLSHLEEAIREGRDPAEARLALGSTLHLREESRDVRLIAWLDSLRGDAVFGWRQIFKRKATSAAAILSLALAIGACTSAFRLMDALLFRPLPVAHADRLYSISFESPSAVAGYPVRYDSCSYPMFQRIGAAVKDQAEAIAISMYGGPVYLTYGSDQEMEPANVQYVSGGMFDGFVLRPAAGRLLTANDDSTPGSHPYAIISYDYWTRRFGKNPAALGRTFRTGNDVFTIVGVAPPGFSGTETGWATDVFLPMAMKAPRTRLASLNNFWLRILLVLKPGAAPGRIQEQLRAIFREIQEDRVRSFATLTQHERDQIFQEKLSIAAASSGRSNMQRDFARPLVILGLLVAMVLLIACANVANLMMAQAASRTREMALRVSIGAGRLRLVQLVLVESIWLAVLSAAAGGLFAWWSAPVILRMIRFGGLPARLNLPADWRVFGFGLIVAFAVTLLFGLTPALRASAVKPVSALRGGEDPHWRGRLMRTLIALQVAFCFVVQLAAGLFVTTFERLSNQPTGFSSERILNVEAVTGSPQSPKLWEQVADHLRGVPGIEAVGLIGWPLLSGESATGDIAVNGSPTSDVFSDFVTISPGWAGIMRIAFLGGRDLRPDDVNPAVAIVNQAFAKQYFNGQDPVGKRFDRVEASGSRATFEVVGWIRDARSRDRLRVPIRPTAYIPFPSVDRRGMLVPVGRGTFVVRTAAGNPLAMAGTLRKEVGAAGSGFRARDIRTQAEINETDTVRERLLAVLASFFAVVALLLAAVGLYGVLDYSVVQRRREIGIRIAIGARPADIVRRIGVSAIVMVLAGAAAGLAIGMACVRYVESILFEVRATDITMLALPSATIVVSAVLAALPAMIRAVQIDPVKMLRSQ